MDRHLHFSYKQIRERKINKEDEIKQINNIQSSSKPMRDDIAVIGISCRFPGANNYNEFRGFVKG